MTDITIPDAAVEAAAKADYERWRHPNAPAWEDADEGVVRQRWRDTESVPLAAAAPHIAAQALEDLLTDAPPTGRVPHPFHSWREWIAYRALRLREPIEAGNG